MRIHSTCLGSALILLLVAGSAFAQDNTMTNAEFGVTMTRPEGWTEVEGNERAIFNIKHEESQSQIEVIATNLMSPDVADVFYDTFHETLEQSSFQRQSVNQQPIGDHNGKLTEYRFEYAGVVLRVVVFQFTHESTAYLIVGYIKDDEFDTHFSSFEEAVASLTFSS